MKIIRFIILFAELTLLLMLVAAVVFGGLPQSLTTLVFSGGMVIALAAAIAFALPSRFSQSVALHGALILGSLVFMLPFVWLVSSSAKYPEELFVFPPKWLPELPDPVAKSPYVYRSEEAAKPELWPTVSAVLPKEMLATVDEDAAKDAVTGRVWKAMESSGLSDIPPKPTDKALVEELAKAAWATSYRSVELGDLSVIDSQDRVSVLPKDAVKWTFENATPTAFGKSTLVTYDFGSTAFFTATAIIDVAKLPPDFRAVTIPMRQDRSWHRVTTALVYGGNQFASSDTLHLGQPSWVSWTFRVPDSNDRDDRSLGVWPLRVVGSSDAASPTVSLTIRVDKSTKLAAAWAKATAAYRLAWYTDPNWPKYLRTSALLVVLNVLGQLLSCSMVAFAFARLRWPGRDAIFVLLLATMMLPAQVTMIPSFLIFRTLGWYDTLLPLTVPSLFGSAFFIFMLRQFMKAIPRELEEAALIDGCSWFGIYWRVILPLLKPALAAVAIFTFMNVWNDFMGPLIYLSDQRHYPLSLGLFNFSAQHNGEFGMLTAASTLVTLPVILLFLVAQRYFIQGVTLTGLKA